MFATQTLVIVGETEGGVESGPDVVFDAAFDGELKDADSPVPFGLSAYGKAVEVYEDVGY
jgi:hypothetical protein